MTALEPSARREALVILVLTLIGAALRAWSFGAIGLTHFDEGIYALAGLWQVAPGGLSALDPMVIPYAPPGFPILVGISYGLFGVADGSAVFPSLLCGIATIPVVGWLGRRTFGAGAGAASAALAALALAHIAFSRKALTDAPFLLFWLVALGLGGWFLERPRLGRALLMGLAVGLAQYFKYNGWLAGVIVIVAAINGALISSDQRRVAALARTFGYGLAGAVVAGLVFWPWYRFVAAHGGYAALLQHHRSYLGGIRQWPAHWSQQQAQVAALSGGWAWRALGWGLAAALYAFAAARSRIVSRETWGDPGRFALAFLVFMILVVFFPGFAWSIGLGWLPFLFGEQRPARRVLGVTWAVLSVLTPFYHPYARLWLPLHAVGWLMLAGALREAGQAVDPGSLTLSRFRLPGLISGALLGLLLGMQRPELATSFRVSWFYEPTTSFRDVARGTFRAGTRTGFSAALANGSPDPVRVLARRPLAFYLLIRGKIHIQLQEGIEPLIDHAPPGTWALVDEAMLLPDPRASAQWAAAIQGVTARWETEAVEIEWLDPVTLLDIDPAAATPGATHRTGVKVWLCRRTSAP